jgi:hypothetical protein
MFVPGAVRYDGVAGLQKLAGERVRFDDSELTNASQALPVPQWLFAE